MKSLLFQIVWLLCFHPIYAQSNLNISDNKNIHDHALDNIVEFERALNLLALSNNPEERRITITNCFEKIFDKSCKIEDDLNPKNIDLKISNFIDIVSYLELFPLIFKLENNVSPVKFSNIYVSEVHNLEYKYVSIYYECKFYGIHKTLNEKFKIVPRVATIRVFQGNNGVRTKIVSIKFANYNEYLNIKGESQVLIDKQNNLSKSTDNKKELKQTNINENQLTKLDDIKMIDTKKVKIVTEPTNEATVIVDEKLVNISDPELQMGIGKHTIRIKMDHYKSYVNTFNVDNENDYFIFIMEPQSYNVTFTTDPTFSKILVDGNFIGKSNLTVPITYGTHKLVIENDNFLKKTKSFFVDGATTQNIKLFPSSFDILGLEYGLNQIGLNWGTVKKGFLLSLGVKMNLNNENSNSTISYENISVYDIDKYSNQTGRVYVSSSNSFSYNAKLGVTLNGPSYFLLTTGCSLIQTNKFQKVYTAEHDYMGETSRLIIFKGESFTLPDYYINKYLSLTVGIIFPVSKHLYCNIDYYSNSDVGPGVTFGLGLILKHVNIFKTIYSPYEY